VLVLGLITVLGLLVAGVVRFFSLGARLRR